MLCVPCPAVMLPLEIDHAYEVMLAGPLAVLPVEFAHTEIGGGVCRERGKALTVTLALPVFEHVPLLTVSVRPTGQVAPAVEVMLCVPCPEVRLTVGMD